MAYGRLYYKLHLLWLFNDAILPASFHLLARSAGAAAGFAFDCFVKLIAATIAAATRAPSPSFCAASPAFRLSKNLAMYPVSISPRANSSSSRTDRKNGIVVRMPPT